MAWAQTRKTRQLLAAGELQDPTMCRHCGGRAVGSTGVCRRPQCATAAMFAAEGDEAGARSAVEPKWRRQTGSGDRTRITGGRR
jgi:hypothetical protein